MSESNFGQQDEKPKSISCTVYAQPLDIWFDMPPAKVKINKRIFYIYIYFDPRKPGKFKYGEYEFDYEPFYVGKGKGNRDISHLNKYHLKKDRNRLKANKILKIQRETGKDPIILRIKIKLTEIEAFELEKKLIKLIGRINLGTGTLTNLAIGGEGFSGRFWTEEMHKKLDKRKHSEETCQEIRKVREGKTYTEIYGSERGQEVSQKISISNTGKKRTLETRAKMSKRRVGCSLTEAHRKHLSIAGKGKIGIYNSILHIQRFIHINESIPEGFKVGGLPRPRDETKKNQSKNKTYKEIYGEEKANEIRKKQSNSLIGHDSIQKGRTYVEMYGEEKANEIRNKKKETRKNNKKDNLCLLTN